MRYTLALLYGTAECWAELESAPVMARKTRSPEPEAGFWQGLIDSLSSIRLAVVLLIVIALTSVLGMLFPQVTASDLQTRELVGEMYRQRYGAAMGGLLLRLGVSDLYHSTWYLGLLLLLLLSAFVCGCKAWRRAQRRYGLPTAKTTPKAVAAMRAATKARSRLAPVAAREASLETLRAMGYQVAHNETDDGANCIVARKRAWAVWGSPLLHLSLLLIVLSAVVSSWPGLGFQRALPLLPGETFNGADPQPTALIPRITDDHRGLFDFAIRLNDFTIDYYPDGRVSAYKSDASVLKDGREVKQHTVRVNKPLKYGPVRFYQSDWGLSGVTVRALGPEGQEQEITFPLQRMEDTWQVVLFDDGTGGMPALQGIEATGWSLFAHAFVPDYVVLDAAGHIVATQRQPSGDEGVVSRSSMPRNPAVQLYLFPDFEADARDRTPLGWMLGGERLSYEGWTFELAGLQMYSGLVAGKNPGVPVLYAGFALIVLSMFVALYLAPRTVRAHLSRSTKGTDVVLGGATRIGPGFEREFERVLAAVEAKDS